MNIHVRALVISGKMSLKEAQKCFTPDWTKTYQTIFQDRDE
jgi:hypothetical protein